MHSRKDVRCVQGCTHGPTFARICGSPGLILQMMQGAAAGVEAANGVAAHSEILASGGCIAIRIC